MKRMLAGLSLLLMLTGAKKPETPPVPTPPAGVTVTQSGGADVVRAVLQGFVTGVELPRRADGKLDVVFLVRTGEEAPEAWNPSGDPETPDEGPRGSRSLQQLDLKGALHPLLPEVPSGKLGVLDLDGDGTEEILLATRGELHSLGSAGQPSERTVLDLSATEFRVPSRWRDQEMAGVLAGGVGTFRLYLPEGGALAPKLERELPSRATRDRWGIRLGSPRVRAVRGETALLVAGPQPEGKQRLRTLLIGEESTTEAWSLLPAPEDIHSAWYVKIDRRPSLIVATNRSDKLGLFEGKKVRVFSLGADRTRAGRRPLLAIQTSSHRWLPVGPVVADLDKDGKDDLVVVQFDGMAGGEIIAETYFGKGDGRFDTPGNRQKWDLQTRDFHFGRDLTGDGVADLAVAEPRKLVIFPGTKEPRKALFEKKPLEIPLDPGGDEAGMRGLRVADLDGDGRAEAVLTGSAGTGRDVVMLVRFR